jgi:hypothetical protein
MVKTLEQARTERGRNAATELSALTANRLADGVVVYLAAGGGWTEQLDEASFATSEAELQSLEEQGAQGVRDRVVVGPYPIAVALVDGEPVATTVRERIRASHRTTLTKDWYDVPL